MAKIQPTLQEITDERKRATMEASQLEAEILKVIIKHAQEHHTPVEIILLALGNSTKHWINKIVNTRITKMLYDEMNDELLSTDAVRRLYDNIIS